MAGLTEAEIQAEILLKIGSRSDVRLWRSQPLVRRETNGRVIRALPVGHPDLAGVIKGGRALFIEVKSESGRLSPEQLSFGAMLQRFGAVYVVARSVADVERALI